MPIFQTKLGPKKPMKIKISFKDLYAQIGQFGVDTTIEYTMCIAFLMDSAKETEVMYDELKMVTSFNMQI
jgi:hypothetical protein